MTATIREPGTDSSTSRAAAPTVPTGGELTLRSFVADQARSRGLGMIALAASAGIGKSRFYAALQDPAKSPTAVQRLAALLEVDPDWLATLPGSTAPTTAQQPSALRDLLDEVAKARGVTRSTLIDSVPVTRSVVYDLLRGARPTYKTVHDLAAALGQPVEVILAATDRPTDPITVALARRGEGVRSHPNALLVRAAGQVTSVQLRRAAAELDDPDLPAAFEHQRAPICDTSTRLGAAVDAYGAKHGLNQVEVARALGLAHQHLAQILSGTIRTPGARSVASIASPLGLSVEEVAAMIAEIPVPWPEEGRRLAQRRAKAGLRQGDLARACGVSQSLISMWESGGARVPARHRGTLDALFATA